MLNWDINILAGGLVICAFAHKRLKLFFICAIIFVQLLLKVDSFLALFLS